MARHAHGPPQIGQLSRLEPGAAHEPRAHQDLDGTQLTEHRREGVQRQLRPVPRGRRRWQRRVDDVDPHLLPHDTAK